MTRNPSVTGMPPPRFGVIPHHASIVTMMYDACNLLFLLAQNNEQSWGASLGSPFPLLAQEVLELLHQLLRVKVAVTLWARHLVHRRVIVLL